MIQLPKFVLFFHFHIINAVYIFFKLDMSSDQITANLQAVINEVCRHRPLNLGEWVAGLDFPTAL